MRKQGQRAVPVMGLIATAILGLSLLSTDSGGPHLLSQRAPFPPERVCDFLPQKELGKSRLRVHASAFLWCRFGIRVLVHF